MKDLGAEIDNQLATTPTEELLDLEVLQIKNIKDTLHAYQLAKRCNVKRVMGCAVKWGEKGARINLLLFSQIHNIPQWFIFNSSTI